MSASLDGGIYETVTLPLFIRLRMNSYTMVIILLLSPLSLLCTVTLGERCGIAPSRIEYAADVVLAYSLLEKKCAISMELK